MEGAAYDIKTFKPLGKDSAQVLELGEKIKPIKIRLRISRLQKAFYPSMSYNSTYPLLGVLMIVRNSSKNSVSLRKKNLNL